MYRLVLKFILTFTLVLLINIGSVSAYSEITVCASDCHHIKIQYAIDSANNGDTILVKDRLGPMKERSG